MARTLIARAMLAADREPPRLAGFTLRPEQRDLVGRVRLALSEFGVAMVADPPGSGKTVVGLAVARGYADVLVIAPATLRTQWERSAARAGIDIRFASIESLSRGRDPAPPHLLVVDEAHQARTPGTARHRILGRLAARAPTLLLTATPVVNRSADRDALLTLGLGERGGRLSPDEVARCVLLGGARVRRAPRVRRIPPLVAGVEPAGIEGAIRALPPPLALDGGGDAGALIRMSLASAWSSSLAALDRALQRRLQRGESLRDLLGAGRIPTRATLRHWILGDDATQLAFAGLLGSPAPAPTTPGLDVATLDAHLEAVRALRGLVRPHARADARSRAEAIVALADAHPSRRVVVFARHAATIGALYDALRAEAGVVALSGQRVRAASGRWSREEILAAVGPRAQVLDRADPRAIRLLLTTDLLAEGVELTGIGIVVHADLPWTPARIAQRRGRIARPGGRDAEVLETGIASPAGAQAIVRLASRLRRKRSAGRRALDEATRRGRLLALLRHWAALDERERIATAVATRTGFVAVVRVDGEALLVAGLDRGPGARGLVSAGTHTCLRACASVLRETAGVDARAVRAARRRLARFLARRAARGLLGGTALLPGDAVARRARRVERIVDRAAPIERPAIAALQRSLLEHAAGSRRAAIDAAAFALLRDPDGDTELRAHLAALPAAPRGGGPASTTRRPRLVALLLLTPADPRAAAAPPPDAPTSASPDTAAPR